MNKHMESYDKKPQCDDKSLIGRALELNLRKWTNVAFEKNTHYHYGSHYYDSPYSFHTIIV